MLEFEKDDLTPIYQQIAEQFRRRIFSGELKPGESLPTVRNLAKALDVSIQTVFSAYQALRADGLVAAHSRRGTIVTALLKQSYARSVISQLEASSGPIMQFERVSKAAGIYSMATEMADPELFQHDEFFGEVAALCRSHPWSIAPGPIEGEGRWRECIAAFLTSTGVPVKASQVVMATSELAALGLVLRAVTEPGESVLVQEPNLMSSEDLFAGLERRAVHVRTEHVGLDLEDLRTKVAEHGCKWLVLKTHFGGLDPQRLKPEQVFELHRLCSDLDLGVIEFDTTRLWCEPPIPQPFACACPDRTIVIHSLSSHMVLGLGLTALVVPDEYNKKCVASLLMSGAEVPSWIQSAFGRYIESGKLSGHIERLNARMSVRQHGFLNAKNELHKFSIDLRLPEGGHRAWCLLPRGLSSTALYDRAVEVGVAILPGTMKLTGPDADNWFSLSCSVLEPSEMASAVTLLAKAISTV